MQCIYSRCVYDMFTVSSAESLFLVVEKFSVFYLVHIIIFMFMYQPM